MVDDYAIAYREVYEILKKLPNEYLNKLPQGMLEMFEDKMDKEYDFKIDLNKNIEEQNFCEETICIIANLFRDYWVTAYQKEKIIAKQNHQRKKEDDEKRKKFNTNDIFKENYSVKENLKKEQIADNNVLPMKVEKENFFTKLINYIKKLLSSK